jgi:hypothetical protein
MLTIYTEERLVLAHGFRGLSPRLLLWGLWLSSTSQWWVHDGAKLLASWWLASKKRDRKESGSQNFLQGYAFNDLTSFH